MRTIATSPASLSATKEDYIRAIYLLQKDDTGARITEIAKRLSLSKSTVSERVQELTTDGLVISVPYSAITLSKKGLLEAKKLTYKHRILEVFLHQTLKVAKANVHQEAERLEHAISDDVIKKLATFLNHPTKDPHGSTIPKITNWD